MFIPSAATLTASVVPHLLIAFSAAMLKKVKNNVTGKEEIVYPFTDADGFENQLVVGQSERDALTKMPSDTALTIRRKVDEALTGDSYRLADSREGLFKGIVAFINGYKDTNLHGDANNPEYLKLKQDALDAKVRLLKLG
jgi:hypothetical protein